MCGRHVQIPLSNIALVLCSTCASASDLTGQVKAIQKLEQEGNLAQAIIETSKLIDSLKQSDPASLLIPEALDRRASLEQDVGKWAEAEHDYTEAITLWKAATAPRPLSLATEFNNLASLYSSNGQFKKAEDLRRRSLALRLEFSGSIDPILGINRTDAAVREGCVLLESSMRQGIGSAQFGQNLIEEFCARLLERGGIPALVKPFKAELKNAFRYIRNDYMHNVRSLELNESKALLTRIARLYAIVTTEFEG